MRLCHRAGSSRSDAPSKPTQSLTWSRGSRENRQRRRCALGSELRVSMGHTRSCCLLRMGTRNGCFQRRSAGPSPPPGLSYPARPTNQGRTLGTRAFFTRLPQGSSDTTPQPASSRLFIAGFGQQLLQAARGQTLVPRAGLNADGLPASIVAAVAPQSQEPLIERQDGPEGSYGLAETTRTRTPHLFERSQLPKLLFKPAHKPRAARRSAGWCSTHGRGLDKGYVGVIQSCTTFLYV